MTQKNNPLYSHVYHDARTDKVYVWYEDGTRKSYNTTHRFYTPIRGEYESMDCGMKDIFGNPVYAAYRNHYDERDILNNHRGPDNHLSEADVEYRTRWLQEHYKGQSELRFSMDNFNICFFDIEIEVQNKFPNPEEAEFPINVVTLYMSKEDCYYTFGLAQDISDRCRHRMSTLNEFLFDVTVDKKTGENKIFLPGADIDKEFKKVKLHPVLKKFSWPKDESIPAPDIAKVMNGILCSNQKRDLLFESIDAENEENEELRDYVIRFNKYQVNKMKLDGRLRKLRKEIKFAPVNEKKRLRDEFYQKKKDFAEWVGKKEYTIKDEKIQKKLVREYLERNMLVTRKVYPKNSFFKYIKCDTESQLISYTFKCIAAKEVDFLSGWNSAGFDLPYLFNRAKIKKISPNLMSRVSDSLKKIKVARMADKQKQFKNKHNYYDVSIAGTTCWDYLMLYKLYSRSERDDVKLDTIGKEEVGDEKRPLSNGFHTYKTNWDEYVEYNVQDTNLLVKIDKEKKFIETSIGVCSQARIPYDGLFDTKKIMVGWLLNYLHDKNMVMPPLKTHPKSKFPGAFVFSKPGHYKHLISYDYRAMYPSIDMAGNISVETKVKFPEGHIPTEEELKNLVISPVDGVYFKKDKVGIIPSVMKHLFDGRVEIKNQKKLAEKEGRLSDAEYLDMKQYAYKIYANSLYGLLGLKYFQFYDRECAHSITALGVDLIKYTVTQVSKYFDEDLANDPRFVKAFGKKPTLDPNLKKFNRFSHGDTDSFFVIYDDLYEPFKDQYTLTEFARIMDEAIFDQLLADILQKFADKWNSMNFETNPYYMKREKCILGALVLAKKKYMCSVESNEDYIYPELKPMTTGMEIVRSSTAPFSRKRLKEMAWTMVNELDKSKMQKLYNKAKADFYHHVEENDILPISTPSGIGKNPPPVDVVMTTKGHHYLVYAGAVWNHLLKNDPVLSESTFEPIYQSSKVKILKVSPYNPWRTNYIAYTGTECPDRLLEIFDVEWESQFEKIYGKTTEKFFETVGWPKKIENDIGDVMDMFS